MKLLLSLLLCVSASAATVPFPKVTRPALSPKHAALPKSTPMKRQTLGGGGGGESPKRLPMKAYCVEVNPGQMDFTAEALQPANQSVLFELSSSLTEGSWVTLAWFGPYPVEQQVFAMVPLDIGHSNIRATAGVSPGATMSRVVIQNSPGIRVNPDVRGVRAWRGTR